MTVARDGPHRGVVEIALRKVTPWAAMSDWRRGISRELTASWSSVMTTTMLRAFAAGVGAGWAVVGVVGDEVPEPQAAWTRRPATRTGSNRNVLWILGI